MSSRGHGPFDRSRVDDDPVRRVLGARLDPVRLIAGSGLQFIDFEIQPELLSLNYGRFFEDQGPDGPVLVPLVDSPDYEGVDWHPVAKRPLRPDETLWLSGYSALEPFLDVWIPLPFLRSIGTGPDGTLL